ncbi:MAG: M1 family aminopeptidase [Ignavibacteriota bacterium]
MRRLLVLAFVVHGTLLAGVGADLARALHENSFDRSECYRVRDITIFKEDLKIYLTDGHLIFSKPVAGHRIAAAFEANVEGGDGEVILLPPNRAERASLASYTGAPNLNEHFRAAMFIFTGSDYDAILSQLPRDSANKKDTEAAAAMDELWSPTLRGLADSFQTRVTLDLLGGSTGHPGLFAALFENAKYGNFDVIFDPNAQEQIAAGRVVQRDNKTYFDTWTSFPARSARLHPSARPEDIVLSDYRIESTLNADLSLDCVTRVKVKPRADGGTAAAFQMTSEMVLASATVDGQPAEILQRDSVRTNLGRADELFLVFPPAPLVAGRTYEFEFKHSGKVIRDAGDHVYYVSARGNWYPNHNLQFAKYDLQFTYPVDLDLVAAGDVVEDRTEGDRRITRRRTASDIRFAAFNLGHYQQVQVERAGYVVDICANRALETALLPKQPQTLNIPITTVNQRQATMMVISPAPVDVPNPVSELQRVAGEVASSLEFMVSKFGPPALPHIAVSPIPGTFGQGFPGLIYISTMAYLKNPVGTGLGANESQQIYFDEFLQAHEVAHQWWGNRVTTTFYRDGWLMEALANVSALLYTEKRKGLHSAQAMLDSYRTLLLQKGPNGQIADSAGPVTFGPRLTSSQAPDAYRTVTYGKGLWVMQMLRRRMGDERFLALLLDIAKRYDHRQITTDEFRQAAVAHLPARTDDPKLETFFEQWIDGTGIPALKLSYSVKGKAPQLRLVGTLTQSDVEADFSTLVPVEIEVARGQTLTQWVRTVTGITTFTVPLTQAPLKVALDPHDSVLRRL